MCAANAVDNRHSSVCNALSAFINGKYLIPCITAADKQHFPHHFFVSYGKQTNVLRVLIGGCCPLCKSTLFRDVCLMTYCNDVVKPVIKKKFPMVNDVVAVHSTDPDLSEIINKNKGEIRCVDFANTQVPYMTLFNYFTCYNSFVDGWYKGCNKKNAPINAKINTSEQLNTHQFFSKYEILWIVQDTTKMVGTDGNLYTGVEAIMNNRGLLMDGLELKGNEATKKMNIVCVKEEFLTNTNFKIVEFP